MNSNQKGKRGEREACKLLQSLGYEARRSQQYSGVRADDNSADIITNIPNIRFEVKYGYNVELWHEQVWGWINKVIEESGSNKWAILYKKTRGQWTVITEIDGLYVQTTEIKKFLRKLND